MQVAGCVSVCEGACPRYDLPSIRRGQGDYVRNRSKRRTDGGAYHHGLERVGYGASFVLLAMVLKRGVWCRLRLIPRSAPPHCRPGGGHIACRAADQLICLPTSNTNPARRTAVHHKELAWALARAADRCIDAGERFDIYVALGAGDTDATIARLTRAIAREQLELPADVLASLATWLSAQAAPEMGEDLGVLIANLKIAREVPPPPPRPRTPVRRRRPVQRRPTHR